MTSNATASPPPGQDTTAPRPRCGRPSAGSAGVAPHARVVAPRGDVGMATAEYAIATLAACGFAGLLVTILRGNEVRGLLLGIVQRALSLG
jgi:hypothetical protein